MMRQCLFSRVESEPFEFEPKHLFGQPSCPRIEMVKRKKMVKRNERIQVDHDVIPLSYGIGGVPSIIVSFYLWDAMPVRWLARHQ